MLRDYTNRAHRLIDRIMTAQGASFARARVLMEIAKHRTVRSSDLASTFGYAPRTVTEAIDGLERDGLVERGPDPDDRRAKRISLTEQGAAAIAATEPSRRHYYETLFGVLSADECDAIVRIVGKLNGRLEELEG